MVSPSARPQESDRSTSCGNVQGGLFYFAFLFSQAPLLAILVASSPTALAHPSGSVWLTSVHALFPAVVVALPSHPSSFAVVSLLVMSISADSLPALTAAILRPGAPVAHRMRGIFALRGLPAGPATRGPLSTLLTRDPSALVRHEAAYALGQMQDTGAAGVLGEVLANTAEDVMVRHEAAEALGAIGDPAAVPLLTRYLEDERVEVRETCVLALARLGAAACGGGGRDDAGGGAAAAGDGPAPAAAAGTGGVGGGADPAFHSVDPVVVPSTPAAAARTVSDWATDLASTSAPLASRYAALFALRAARGTPEEDAAVDALCAAAADASDSALLRHEVCYVLGQMAPRRAVGPLAAVLAQAGAPPMVRHEAAEALGAIGGADVEALLRDYTGEAEGEAVVRESCEVALDMSEWLGDAGELHYTHVVAEGGAATGVAAT